MRRGYGYSYKRRRSKDAKWLHLFAALLLIGTIRVIFRDTAPAPGLAGIEGSAVESGIKDGNTSGIASDSAAPNARQAQMRPPRLDRKTEELMNEIKAGMNAGPSEIINVRDKLNKVLSEEMGENAEWARGQLARLSEQWLFGPEVFAEDEICGSYEVKFGDMFTEIERKFKTPYEMLMRINSIEDPRSLRAGKKIKVVHGPFHCKVYCSAQRMDVFVQDVFVRSFPVIRAKNGLEIAAGSWVVKAGGKHISETKKPAVRWIVLESTGASAEERTVLNITAAADSDEERAEEACVRVADEDLALIYDLLMPKVSSVTVSE
jgi:hypothetical protein